MAKKQHSELEYDYQSKTVKLPETKTMNDFNREKTWIIYARVSTPEQANVGNWINAQIIDCEKRAKQNHVKIVHEPFMDEWISWTKLDRKWFIEAIEFIEKENNVDYFICNSTSRFSRSPNLSETFEMVARVNAAWSQLVAVWNWGIQDMDSEAGFLNFWLNSILDALESKRWAKRVRYWQIWKLMEWYRPFWDVPVGYKRSVIKEWWKELRILVLDEEKALILKDWLEQFADGIIATKQELYEFYCERWLKSNSKTSKTGKLHKSFPDRVLSLRKLYVYAGYLTYPDRWVYDLIPAKHPAIINLDTVDKIMVRLKKYKWVNDKKKVFDEDIDEYPLKRVLLCPECNKAVTKWKSLSHTWDYHHYYGCNNKWCILFKKWLPREKVHEAVRERLKSITPSRDIEKYFNTIFKEERNAEKIDMKKINADKTKEIEKLKIERDKVENILASISNEALFKKKEKERAEINQKIDDLEYSIKDITFEEKEFEKTLNEAKTVLFNPLAIWDYWDYELKKLIIGVCFNNKIYYKKNLGLHTPEISVLYSYFCIKKTSIDIHLG